MKKKVIKFSIAIVFLCTLIGGFDWLTQKTYRYYFINKTGKVVISTGFQVVGSFSNGRARVGKPNQQGFIDKTGKIIIPAQYESVDDFSHGLAVVAKNGKKGCIDTMGKVVIPLIYDEISTLGLKTSVLVKLTQGNKHGIAHLPSQKVTIQAMYNEVDLPWLLTKEWAWIQVVKDGKRGLVNAYTGEVLLPPAYSRLQVNKDFTIVSQGDKQGLFNHRLRKMVIPVGDIQIYAESSSPNLVNVFEQEGTGRGVVNIQGKFLVPSLYDHIYSSPEKLLKVNKDGHFGFIDQSGQIMIPLVYDYAKNFSNGLAPVQQNGRWGVIDATGKVVIEPQFQELYQAVGSLFLILKDRRKEIIDVTGKSIASFDVQSDIKLLTNRLVAFKEEGLWGVMDMSKKIIQTPQFSSIYALSNWFKPQTKHWIAFQRDNLWGVMNTAGKIIHQPTLNVLNDIEFITSQLIQISEKSGEKKVHKIINIHGKTIVPAKFRYLGLHKPDTSSMIILQPKSPEINNAPGVVLPKVDYMAIDAQGAVLVPQSSGYQFISSDEFEGLRLVTKGEKSGFIDSSGKLVIPLKYVKAESFSEGLALVERYDLRWKLFF